VRSWPCFLLLGYSSCQPSGTYVKASIERSKGRVIIELVRKGEREEGYI